MRKKKGNVYIVRWRRKILSLALIRKRPRDANGTLLHCKKRRMKAGTMLSVQLGGHRNQKTY